MTALPPTEELDLLSRMALADLDGEITEEIALAIIEDSWPWTRRPAQEVRWDDPWSIWLYMAARRVGKTKAIVRAVNEAVWEHGVKRIGIGARTGDDLRRVLLFGPTGFANEDRRDRRPHVPKQRYELNWANGAHADCLSAEVPESGRGPGYELIVCDELAFWRRTDSEGNNLYDNMMIAASEGEKPRVIAATTPSALPLLKEIMNDPETRLTHEGMEANRANLPLGYIERMIRRYPKGTHRHRTEILGELVEDIEGALWAQHIIDAARIAAEDAPPLADMERVVVSVDPAASKVATSDFTATCVAGRLGDDAYVFRSRGVRKSPEGWARDVRDAYEWAEADLVVAEVNNGGDMVESTLRAAGHADLPVKKIRASRGKEIRAEPVRALFGDEDNPSRVHFVGEFAELEDQMTTFPVANEHDDELDAMVYAVTELLLGGRFFIQE